MNTVYNKATGQKIDYISDELLTKYNVAEWLINPEQAEIDSLLQTIETVALKKKLRQIGQEYVDTVLAVFMQQLGTDAARIIHLDGLLDPVKASLNVGEFFTAQEVIKAIPLDVHFTQALKDKFVNEITALVTTYYPQNLFNNGSS